MKKQIVKGWACGIAPIIRYSNHLEIYVADIEDEPFDVDCSDCVKSCKPIPVKVTIEREDNYDK